MDHQFDFGLKLGMNKMKKYVFSTWFKSTSDTIFPSHFLMQSWRSAKQAWFHFGGDDDDDDLLAKSLVKQVFLEDDFVLEIKIISTN